MLKKLTKIGTLITVLEWLGEKVYNWYDKKKHRS